MALVLASGCASTTAPCDTTCDAGADVVTLNVTVVAVESEPGLAAAIAGFEVVAVSPDGGVGRAMTGADGVAQVPVPSGTEWDITARKMGYGTLSVTGVRDPNVPIRILSFTGIHSPRTLHQVVVGLPPDPASGVELLGPDIAGISTMTSPTTLATQFAFRNPHGVFLQAYLIGYNGTAHCGGFSPIWAARIPDAMLADRDLSVAAPAQTFPVQPISLTLALPTTGMLTAAALFSAGANMPTGMVETPSLTEELGFVGLFSVCGRQAGNNIRLDTSIADAVRPSSVAIVDYSVGSALSVHFHLASPRDGETVSVHELRSVGLAGGSIAALACAIDGDGYVAAELRATGWTVFGATAAPRAPHLPTGDTTWADTIRRSATVGCSAQQRRPGASPAPYAFVNEFDPDATVSVTVLESPPSM